MSRRLLIASSVLLAVVALGAAYAGFWFERARQLLDHDQAQPQLSCAR